MIRKSSIHTALRNAIATLTFLVSLFFFFSGAAQSSQDRQLADQYLNNAEYEKAAELYDKLMDKDPFGTYPQYYRCLLAMKNYSEAEKLTKKIIKKLDQPNYYVDLGYIYAQQGQSDKAKAQYDKALKMLKPDQGSVMTLAAVFMSKGESEYALQTYMQGRNMLRGIYDFYFEVAEVYYQKGDFAKMTDEYLNAVEDNPMTQQSVLNVLQARVGIDPDNSRTEYLRTSLLRRIQKNPDKPEFSEMLIWLFIQQKDFDSAFLQAKALDKRQKEDGTRLMSIGNMAASNESYDVALKCYQYVIDKGPTSSNYIQARMELLNTYNKKVTESNTYTKADLDKLKKDYLITLDELGRSPRTVSIIKGLAHLRAFYLDETDSAIAELDDAIDMPGLNIQPKAECKLELGDILLFTGDVWDSDLLYAQVDKDFKHDPLGQEAKFRGARLDYFRGDFQWAQAQLDVLKSATSQLIANDALALSLLISDNQGLDSTTDALMLYAHADLLSYRNKNDEALLTLDTLLRQFPSHSLVDDAWFKMADIMDKKHEWQKEDSLYALIVDKDSSSVIADDALYRRAELHETKLNDKEKAMSLYQQLIINYPGSVFVTESRKRYRGLRGDVVN